MRGFRPVPAQVAQHAHGQLALEVEHASECVNLYRLVLSPTGLRPMIRNWEDVARQVVMRVRRELSAVPAGPQGPAMLEEMLSIPGLPDDCYDVTPEMVARRW